MSLIIIVLLLAIAMFWLKCRLENCKSHELLYRVGQNGSINVYDKEELIAIVYKDLKIDFTNERPLSLYKLSKINEVAYDFDKLYIQLKNEE